MKYLYVNDDMILAEIIPGIDPTFPGVDINERYSQEFISQCIKMEDDDIESSGIKVGMSYDKNSGSFFWPEPAEPEVPEQDGYTITDSEVNDAYREGVNNAE